MDLRKKYWSNLYRKYPVAFKAFMERDPKTDIMTDFFAQFNIYVEFREKELRTGPPQWEFYVEAKHLMIEYVGYKTEVGAIRKSVVVMFDILDQQLRNQNYLNN